MMRRSPLPRRSSVKPTAGTDPLRAGIGRFSLLVMEVGWFGRNRVLYGRRCQVTPTQGHRGGASAPRGGERASGPLGHAPWSRMSHGDLIELFGKKTLAADPPGGAHPEIVLPRWAGLTPVYGGKVRPPPHPEEGSGPCRCPQSVVAASRFQRPQRGPLAKSQVCPGRSSRPGLGDARTGDSTPCSRGQAHFAVRAEEDPASPRPRQLSEAKSRPT